MGDGPRDQIARRFRVFLGIVKKLLQQRRRCGDIAPQHHRSGRKPLILAPRTRTCDGAESSPFLPSNMRTMENRVPDFGASPVCAVAVSVNATTKAT
jgi:hypothetical protein